MDNETILKQAIEKAVKNGYGKDYGSDTETRSITILSMYQGSEKHDIEHLIFSQDFAKAFWGETREGECRNPNCECHKINPELKMCCNDCRNVIVGWKQSLQLMVLEKEPLQYLKKYL